jgi:hypothetical protein
MNEDASVEHLRKKERFLKRCQETSIEKGNYPMAKHLAEERVKVAQIANERGVDL